MQRFRGVVLALILAVVGVIGVAEAVAQGAYSLEFQAINEGGAKASSATYESDQQLVLIGAAASAQSATYEITNVLDFAQPPSAVQFWMLY